MSQVGTICRFRDYRFSTVITAQTSPAAATATPSGGPALKASLAAAIDAQARRVDQLSAAILRATAQVTWSGRAADRFRARASERARECLQLAVALRASAERVNTAANAKGTAAAHAIPIVAGAGISLGVGAVAAVGASPGRAL
jgi:small-conductance mechanosensitive channel